MDKNNETANEFESRIAIIHFLFREKTYFPSAEEIHQKLQEKLGNIDIMAKEEMKLFSLLNYTAIFEEEKQVPIQLMISDYTEAKKDLVPELAKSQIWVFEDWEEVLAECPWQLIITDMLGAWLPAFQRAEILSSAIDVILELYPNCVAVYYGPSQNFVPADYVRDNPYEGHKRYLHGGLKARFFRIKDSEDMLVDTIGFKVLNLPDMQYHFRDLDPSSIVNHALNIAYYQYENDAIIKSGDTIDGVEDEIWTCQYEESLLEPKRILLDVNTGKYASGNRNQQ
jgi:hypothetical protein